MPQNTEDINKLKNYFIEKMTNENAEIPELARELSILDKNKSDYRGRELLELIQNIDDAAFKGNCANAKAYISLKNSTLTILNQGEPFDIEGLKAIYAGYLSNKTDGTTIGNKGIGFRGVLNWADSIKIYSGNFAVEFSEEYAKYEFEKYKTNSQVIKSIEQRENLKQETYFPMLSVPHNIEFPNNWINNKYNGIYDTCIELHIRGKTELDNIVSQIQTFLEEEYKCLLFLRNLKEIIFDVNDIFKECRLINDVEQNIVNVQTTHKNNIENNNYFYLFKDNDISIAFPKQWNSSKEYKLFSFFPLKNMPSPFPVILHAEKYDVTQDRNSLCDSENNKNIMKRQLLFLIEVAKKFIDMKYGFQTLEMLNYYSIRPFDEFETDFLNIICSERIIRNINNELISLNDNPKILNCNYPSLFVGQLFNNLVTHNIKNYLPTKLHSKILFYSYEELCNIINILSSNWSIEDCINMFFWWKEDLKCNDYLPKLIKNSRGEFFEYYSTEHDLLWFYSGAEIKDMPQWCSFSIVFKEYQNKILELMPESIKKLDRQPDRALSRKYNNDFNYLDKSTILPKINNSINNIYERALEFMKFLYINYDENDWFPPDTINTWFFPDDNGNVIDSQYLYFGEEYNNESGSKLCALSKLQKLCSISKLNIENIDVDKFRNFFKKFNIKEWIVPYKQDFSFIYNSEKYISEKFNKDYAYYLFARTPYDTKQIRQITINSYVDNLEHILNSLDENIILKWLDWLKNNTSVLFSEDAIYYATNNRYNATKHRITNYKFNYFKFIVGNTKWLKTNEKKYSPRELITTSKYKNNKIVATIPKNLKEHINLLKNFGTGESLINLDPDIFYRILLELPEHDEDGEIAKKIYNEIADISDDNLLLDTRLRVEFTSKGIFLKQGKVFAKNRKNKNGCFVDINDVFFTNRKVLNFKNQYIMITPPRNGKFENFKIIFGIDKFDEKNISIENTELHSDNDMFQEEWEHFKLFIQPYSKKNMNIKNHLLDLKVSLIKNCTVKDIETNIEENIDDIDDYFLLKNNLNVNHFYIYLNTNSKYDKMKIAVSIGEIFENIANSGEIIREQVKSLFIVDDETRKYYLEDWGYDTSLLENSDTIKNSFIKIAKEINPNIDVTMYINDIDFSKPILGNLLIDILTKLNVDIDIFYEKGFKGLVNFKEYHKDKLIDIIHKYKKEYFVRLFKTLELSSDVEKHKTFLEERDKFINLANTIESFPEKSKNFDYDKIIRTYFEPLVEYNQEIDFDKIYGTNKKIFISEKDNDIVEDILSNKSYNSLLYFGDFEELNNIYNAHKPTDILVLQEEDNNKAEISDIKIKTYEFNNSISTRNSPKRLKESKLSNKQKVKNGKLAEQKVYNILCEKYKNVEWISKQDDSKGYDISYSDNGITYFVEVKSATPEGKENYSFYLSRNEEETANQYKSKYKIMIYIPSTNKIHLINYDELKTLLNKSTRIETKKCFFALN